MNRNIRDLWRFSKVEHKILRCSQLGQAAIFEREENGEKPVVSSGFLADVWMGEIDGHNMHPNGLQIEGLQIEGTLKARDNPYRDGYARLAPLEAKDCTFCASIQARNTCLTSILLENCDVGQDTVHEQFEFDVSIAFDECDISSSVIIRKSICAAIVGLTNSDIGGTVSIDEAKLSQTLNIEGVKACSFYCYKSELTNTPFLYGDAYHQCIAGASATFRQGIRFDRCQTVGTIFFPGAKCNEFAMERCHSKASGGMAAVFLYALQTIDLSVTLCRFSDRFDALALECSGNVELQYSFFANQDENKASFNLSGAKITGDAYIDVCLLEGCLALDNAQVGSRVVITGCYISGLEDAGSGSGVAIVARQSKLGGFAIFKCKVAGGMDCRGCVLKNDLFLGQSAFVPLDVVRKENLLNVAAKNEFLDEISLDFGAAQIGKGFVVQSSVILGHLAAPRLETMVINIYRSAFIASQTSMCLDILSSKVAGHCHFEESTFTAGIRCVQAQFESLDLSGCTILPTKPENGLDWAIFADDLQCEQDLTIRGSETGDNIGYPSDIIGVCSFDAGNIGGGVYVRSSSIALSPGNIAYGTGVALSLNGTKIAGSLIIGRTFADYADPMKHYTAPRIKGAVSLANAEIGQTITLHNAQIEAVGQIERPRQQHQTEERVTRRNRGVCVSMRRAKVEGELVIGEPTLSGLFDLRDADIRMISDLGGEQWGNAGLKHGQLLLDGLNYRDLDEVHRDNTEMTAVEITGDAVKRRLDWLALQYPDGAPSLATFVPQPYEQLASIFAAEGNERARRSVQIAKRDLQREHGGLKPVERGIQWLLKTICEYGYSPTRAISFVLVYFGFGAVIATALNSKNALILASVDAAPETAFNPLVYAIDSAIPIIDLNQDGVWTLDPSVFDYGWAMQATVFSKGLYEIFGMLLISITILTLTGTLRDKE